MDPHMKWLNGAEIYVSTDIEADGPIPGVNSMLSFASAAFSAGGELQSTFSANINLLDGAVQDKKTMEFWDKNKAAYEATRFETIAPFNAMHAYVGWLEELGKKPVFVGYPAAYDFMFVYWYLMRFVGRSPFSHSALDIKTLAFSVMKRPYRECVKKNMPKRWFDVDAKHTHRAIDDAIEQGKLFCAILKEGTEKGDGK